MALEALATDVIKSLAEKLFSAAVQEILFIADTESHIKNLTNTKAMIEAVLLDADARSQDQEDHSDVQRQELEQFIRVLDKIDDLLDEKATRSELKKLAAARGFKDQVRWFFSSDMNPVVSLCRDDRQVKDIRKKLDSITKDHALFNSYLLSKLTKPKPRALLDLETGSHTISEEIIGRGRDRDNIIRGLFDSSSSFSVIAIVGIGGMGKTTLAQYVYNDERVKKYFDQRLWVYATRGFGVNEILEKILECMGEKRPLPSTKDSLQQLLLKKIERRKYLLVLDDIWDDDNSLSKKWEELRKLLACGGVGSKVLITTRDEKVARTVDSGETYKLGDLGKENSWLLFQQAAFPHGGKVDQGLESIGQQILEKFPRVPLVIRAIGGLLKAEEPTEDRWRAVRDGPLQNLSAAVPNVMESLKLSYNQLDPRLKLCFAYCSLFPRGWEFKKDELICLWIALGYVEERYRTQSLEDAGEEYVLSLKNRGFFQNAEKDEFGCITTFRMHDMMYDLAVSVASSKYKMLDSICVETDHELDKRVGYSHVSFNEKTEDPLPLLLEHKENLRSLLLFCVEYSSCQPQLNELSRFRHLRVLRLGSSDLEVPKSIGKLIHLRYLDLSQNDLICKLPNSITRLVNLLSLDLSDCDNLVELPRDIRKLVKLRHLNLDRCGGLSHMPSGLGNLTNLQTLGWFVVSNNKGVGGLDELNCLNNLKGNLALMLQSDFEYEGANEILMANLKEKSKLVSLYIDMHCKQSKEKSEIVLEGLQPPPNLRLLGIARYNGERLPSWMMSWGQLPNLVQIYLGAFDSCKYLCCFGRLPHLKDLMLSNMRQLEYVVNTSTATSRPHPIATASAPNPLFPSLEELGLKGMPKLKGWRKIMCTSSTSTSSGEEESQIPQNCGYYSAFPKLKKLVFYWVGLEAVPEEFRGLSALESLVLFRCDELKELPEWIDSLNSLKELFIATCPKLKSLPKQMGNLSNLEKLEIGDCPILEERCKEPTGDDWPLIQHVPHARIG